MAMKTPGVYIVEKNAFPNSIVEVATAVPAFIGYTERAMNGNVPLTGTPWRISSMSEFQSYFGFAAAPTFTLDSYKEFSGTSPLSAGGAGRADPLPRAVFSTVGPKGEEKYELKQKGPAYALYGAMRLFFQNGGGPCYVVSIGSYADDIDAEKMLSALDKLKLEPEPTMVVIPETTRLVRQDAVKVQQAMLKHCGTDMKNRFAILDIFGGYLGQKDPLGNPVATFRNDLGINNLDFGAAYYPWVNSSVFGARDFTYENIAPESRGTLIGLLKRSMGNGGDVREHIDRVGVPALLGDFKLTLTKGAKIPITAEDITARDDLSTAEELTYKVAGKPEQMKGQIVETDDDTKTRNSFTQSELEAGNISFKHDGEGMDPGFFELTVTDEHGISTDAKTIGVEVVSAMMDAASTSKGEPVEINVTENDDDADPATVQILRADKDSEGKVRTVAGEGLWKVGDGGVITFTAEAGFVGPQATIKYTVANSAGERSNPAEVRVTVGDTAGGAARIEAPSPQVIDKTLRAIVPLYSVVMNEMAARLNAMPPAAAMAGVYTMIDNSRGVWKAPANVSLNSVVSPKVNIGHEEQENLNVSTTGKSINAIRPFVGEGTLVWGARTLDGNSLDWRYINVRRTMIMLEESIRLAAKAYVFEPNVANTWVTMRSMIENFLTNQWKSGALAGASPQDAFSVHVGLGDTMTPVDILEGILRITVLVAISRPAEFIEITFQQQMQKS